MSVISSPAPLRVFLSYSRQDHPSRQKLESHLKLLQRQQIIDGWSDQAIEAGQEWEPAISAQLEAAEIILLLVSTDFLASDHCWGVQMERALQRHQEGSARVIPIILRPVDLTGAPFMRLRCLPREGKPVVTWPIEDEAWTDVAQGIRRVAEGLRRGPPPVRPVPSGASSPRPDPGPWRTFRPAIGAALRLDRCAQWNLLRERCEGRRHTFFLLFGNRRQNVSLFVDRIWHYLTDERDDHPLVIAVPFRHEGRHALCAADWERHLRDELAGALQQTHGDAAELLTLATEERPLFLLIGSRPIDRLSPEQQSALREFISGRVPLLLARVAARSPVWLLLAIDYPDEVANSLVPHVDEWAEAAERLGLSYCRLREVELPSWKDVEEYLWNYEPRPSRSVIDAIRQEYVRLTSGTQASFRDLADELDRSLQEA